jgi:glycosyltransferase involved in cell wall biosynthesis
LKVLLVTDIPPCKNFTAGLVLDQLCRFMPKGSIACFTVLNPNINAKLSPDLEWIPIEYCEKPRENVPSSLPRQLGMLAALGNEMYNSKFKIGKITKKIVNYGKGFKADVVWCVLQGQTMIRLARPIADGLGVPLLTQIWDPPTWWMRANNITSYAQRSILNEFDSALRFSSGCAAASWSMAERYYQDYGTRTVPLIPSIGFELALPPSSNITDHSRLTIGMAGQIYATEEWNALIRALDSVDWIIDNRQVSIRVMGRYVNLNANGKMRIEFLGWSSQKDTITLMSECDVLYCPYWFDSNFKDEAKLSFPSKLTTYLAAGRPVFFHGPEYSSPARFLRENEAGLCCYSLSTEEIIKTLTKLVSDKRQYMMLSQNGSVAFKEYLTLESMRRSFADFLQVDQDFLVEVNSSQINK